MFTILIASVPDHNVLLIEARDRVGGRTYTAKKDGKTDTHTLRFIHNLTDVSQAFFMRWEGLG